jgi:hypothetical protein
MGTGDRIRQYGEEAIGTQGRRNNYGKSRISGIVHVEPISIVYRSRRNRADIEFEKKMTESFCQVRNPIRSCYEVSIFQPNQNL